MKKRYEEVSQNLMSIREAQAPPASASKCMPSSCITTAKKSPYVRRMWSAVPGRRDERD